MPLLAPPPATRRLAVLPGADPGCTSCNRAAHPGVENVCIPTSFFAGPGAASDVAVLVLGEAPGGNENVQGRNFVGKSGERLFSHYVHASGLAACADVYAGNVVRCWASGNPTPTKGERRSCASYLAADLTKLRDAYDRVAVLAVGAPAVAALDALANNFVRKPDLTLNQQFRRQGWAVIDDRSAVFGTWHPAATLDGRAPHRLSDVKRHCAYVLEWILLGALSKETPPAPLLAPPPPSDPLDFDYDLETFVCLDNDEYNALGSSCPEKCCREGPSPDCRACRGTGRTQTRFHPVAMALRDGVPLDKLVVCASVCWRALGGAIHTGYFDFADPEHVRRFVGWLQRAASVGGQHIVFDAKLTRALFGLPRSDVPLRDLLIRSFKYDDLMPERSLDALAIALRLAPYEQKHPVRAFPSTWCPEIIDYACRDPFNSRRGREVCDRLIDSRFGGHPLAGAKTAPSALAWESALLRTQVHIEESGLAFDLDALEAAHSDYDDTLARLEREAETYNLVLRGEGSKGSVESLIATCCELLRAHAPDPDAVLDHLATTGTGALSTDKDNRAALLGALPRDHADCANAAAALSLVSEHRSIARLRDSYTRPYLEGKRYGPYKRYEERPRAIGERWCVPDACVKTTWHLVKNGRKPSNKHKFVETRCGMPLEAEGFGADDALKWETNCPECRRLTLGDKPPTVRVKVPDQDYYVYDRREVLLPLADVEDFYARSGLSSYDNPFSTGVVSRSRLGQRAYQESASVSGAPSDPEHARTDSPPGGGSGCGQQGRRIGVAFPHYYPVSRVDQWGKRAGTSGTTRWSADRVQTHPPPVRRTYISRFERGVLTNWDLAQIEWRMAMWLANDETGLAEIRDGFDVHAHAAEFLFQFRVTDTGPWLGTWEAQQELMRFPDTDVRRYFDLECRDEFSHEDYPDFETFLQKTLRQKSKSGANFPELYGAMAATTQRSLRRQTGIEVPREVCDAFHAYKAQRYPAREAYRTDLLNRACRDKALHLPGPSGWSRSFGLATSDDEIRTTYREQILDFEIQSHAFCIMICAIGETIDSMRALGLRARVCLQTHDSLMVDYPADEEAAVRATGERHLANNWYLRELVALGGGRPFPLEFDSKEVYRGA